MSAYGKDCSAYPNSYNYYHNLITLPLHTLLSDEDIDYVCETLKEVIAEVKGHWAGKEAEKMTFKEYWVEVEALEPFHEQL